MHIPCFPRCEVPLPDIGAARVATEFNVCTSPAKFSIRIIHEVRSISQFSSFDRTLQSRKIGTEHWPLTLNVQFYEQAKDLFFVKACVVTERQNSSSCFIDSTIFNRTGLIPYCNNMHVREVSTTPSMLVSILFAFFFLITCLTMIVIAQRILTYCAHRRRKMHKQSQIALLPSPRSRAFQDDDRLTVIEEEKEDRNSPASSVRTPSPCDLQFGYRSPIPNSPAPVPIPITSSTIPYRKSSVKPCDV
ncbi:hypothetical protein WR25_25047 [Diploscapter pachys]|uniref:Uncharacterized protein n=1 Tax=Diploscapter pachys TaxID=2018661 RepID=A0A2A2K6Y4_9BILA|nr:hypothetical protein WR25_25047 [Diploscapter pachys]